MKKLLLPFFILLIQLSLVAQSKLAMTLPTAVTQIFEQTFPNASNMEWGREGEYYTVKFSVQNNQNVHLVYNEQGQVIEKYMELPRKDVPADIARYLKQHFPDYLVSNYWVKQKGGDRIYKVEVSSEFEGKGSIIGISSGKSMEMADTTGVSTKESYKTALNSVVYFDKAGSTLSTEEAIEGKKATSKVEDNEDSSAAVAKNRSGRKKK